MTSHIPPPNVQQVAVLTLVQKRDFPSALASLGSIASQLSELRHQFVLINDEHAPKSLVRQLSGPFRTVIKGRENAGVAAGRNVLISEAMQWGADLLVVLDDDILVPSDYLDALALAWNSHSEEKRGLMAPALLNYSYVAPRVFSIVQRANIERGQIVDVPTSDAIAEALRASVKSLPASAVDHLGIRGWQDHYFKVGWRAASRYMGVTQPTDRPNVVRLDQEARDLLLQRSVDVFEVDTVAGGASTFTRQLVEDIGPIDEAFGPFGFEDAEFSIRALRAGYVNMSLPGTVALHDLQGRLRNRDMRVVLETRGRSRALLIRKHCSESMKPTAFIAALLEGIDAFNVGRTTTSPSSVWDDIGFYYSGLLDGLIRRLSTDDAQIGLHNKTVQSAMREPVLDLGRSMDFFSAESDPSIRISSLWRKQLLTLSVDICCLDDSGLSIESNLDFLDRTSKQQSGPRVRSFRLVVDAPMDSVFWGFLQEEIAAAARNSSDLLRDEISDLLHRRGLRDLDHLVFEANDEFDLRDLMASLQGERFPVVLKTEFGETTQ